MLPALCMPWARTGGIQAAGELILLLQGKEMWTLAVPRGLARLLPTQGTAVRYHRELTLLTACSLECKW